MKKTRVKVDSRNRICLTKIAKTLATSYSAYIEDNRIVLEPLIEISAKEAWLFEPKNKAILQKIEKALKQEKVIDRGSFAKYAKTKAK